MTWAPNSSNRSDKALALLRARVTTIVLPNNGLLSNQRNCSRKDTTSPTITIAGAFNCAFSTSSTTCSKVETNVSWIGFVPQRMTATGVSLGRPYLIKLVAMFGKLEIPITKEIVSTDLAKPSQFIPDSGFVGSS